MRTDARVRLRAAFDALIAFLAVATLVSSLLLPWYQATLTLSSATGWVVAPSGAATGVYAHASLWAAVGIAAAQIALLAARYYPGGRLRVPGDSILIALGSAITSSW